MEIWLLPAALGLITLVNGVILWKLNELRERYVATFTETLNSLVSEWNVFVQTVNALTMTLPEAGNGNTGHLTASEGALPEDTGMSASKRALYAQRRGAQR